MKLPVATLFSKKGKKYIHKLIIFVARFVVRLLPVLSPASSRNAFCPTFFSEACEKLELHLVIRVSLFAIVEIADSRFLYWPQFFTGIKLFCR